MTAELGSLSAVVDAAAFEVHNLDAPIPVPSPVNPDARIVNAMTIDVEDYFHVSVFDGVLPRQRWNTLESRVCRNTERLLDIFSEHDVRGTFFVLGWVAERWPELVKRIAAGGHEIASHGFGHR